MHSLPGFASGNNFRIHSSSIRAFVALLKNKNKTIDYLQFNDPVYRRNQGVFPHLYRLNQGQIFGKHIIASLILIQNFSMAKGSAKLKMKKHLTKEEVIQKELDKIILKTREQNGALEKLLIDKKNEKKPK